MKTRKQKLTHDRFSRDSARWVDDRTYFKTIQGKEVQFEYYPRTQMWGWKIGRWPLPDGTGTASTPRKAEAKARHYLEKIRGTQTWPPKRDVKGGGARYKPKKKRRQPNSHKSTREFMRRLYRQEYVERHARR